MKTIQNLLKVCCLLMLLGAYTPVIKAQSDTAYVPRPAKPSELKQASQEQSSFQEGTSTEEESSIKSSVTSQQTQTVEDTQNKTKEPLFENDVTIYTLNEFSSEKDLKDFKSYLDKQAAVKGQINLEDVSKEGRFLLAASYTDQADKETQAIILYLPFSYDSKAEAQSMIDEQLKIYPDLFFAGEVVENNGSFDVAFGIRSGVNTQAFSNDVADKKLFYNQLRTTYYYQYPEGQEDPYQSAIETAFPGQFDFKTKTESGQVKVEMSQLSMTSPQNAESSENERTKSILQKVISFVQNIWEMILKSFNQLVNSVSQSSLLTTLGLSESSAPYIVAGLLVGLVLIGLLLIVIAKR